MIKGAGGNEFWRWLSHVMIYGRCEISHCLNTNTILPAGIGQYEVAGHSLGRIWGESWWCETARARNMTPISDADQNPITDELTYLYIIT